MILWISIGVFIISAVASIIINEHGSFNKEWPFNISVTISAIFGIVTILMMFVILLNFWGVNGYHEKLRQQQAELQYQAEHTTILSKYKTMKDIEAWNTDLASNKKNQRDFWFGVFIPDIYDDLDYVEIRY